MPDDATSEHHARPECAFCGRLIDESEGAESYERREVADGGVMYAHARCVAALPPPPPIGPNGIPLPEGMLGAGDEFMPLGSFGKIGVMPPPSFSDYAWMSAWEDILAWARGWVTRARVVAGVEQAPRQYTIPTDEEPFGGPGDLDAIRPLHVGHPVVEAWCEVFAASTAHEILALEQAASAYVPWTQDLQELAKRTLERDESVRAQARALLPAVELQYAQLETLCKTRERGAPSSVEQAIEDLWRQRTLDRENRNTFGQGSF